MKQFLGGCRRVMPALVSVAAILVSIAAIIFIVNVVVVDDEDDRRLAVHRVENREALEAERPEIDAINLQKLIERLQRGRGAFPARRGDQSPAPRLVPFAPPDVTPRFEFNFRGSNGRELRPFLKGLPPNLRQRHEDASEREKGLPPNLRQRFKDASEREKAAADDETAR